MRAYVLLQPVTYIVGVNSERRHYSCRERDLLPSVNLHGT